MTVSSSTNRVSYSGNGTLTTFAYTFKVFDQGDLTVILRSSTGTETVQTITTHYTVTGVGDVGGGNVVFVTAPSATETVVILREQDLTQGLDLVPNDPFPAQSLEESLDKLTFMVQQHEEELGRAIKASRTNTLTGSEFTISAADRANKVFSFDSSGDLSVTQELGTFKGDWAASTAYVERDLVKDTTTNNVFIVTSAHTSSGSLPLTTNTNSAKYEKIIDITNPPGDVTFGGSITTSSSVTAGSFVIGSADINENDLEAIDEVIAGTVAASKAVVVDINKDISSFRNLTATGDITFGSLSDGTITVTAFVDEDNMASDSATLVPTQQSVKAYVDAQVATADTLTEILGNGNTTSGANIQMTTTDELQFRDTALKISSSVDGQLDIDADTEIEITAPTVDINASTEVNISGAAKIGGTLNIDTIDELTTDAGTTINSTFIGNNKIGIGTSVVGDTQVAIRGSAAKLRLESTSVGNHNWDVGVFTTSFRIYHQATGQNPLWINSSDNVGIGTTSPSTKLDVNGTVTATGGAFTGDVSFGDNDKAIFGTGSDLQIYHDGSNSYIKNNTGVMRIHGTEVQIKDEDNNETLAVFNPQGSVDLYYDNSKKLATTSTGIDVTGTVTADGLTVDGGTGNYGIEIEARTDFTGISGQLAVTDSTGSAIFNTVSGSLNISTGATFGTNTGTQRLQIGSGGDISFYEDTGTTAKFFWDASAESLGIGTTSPSYKLETKDGDIATVKLTAATSGNAVNGMRFRVNNSANTAESATLGMVNAETVNSWGGVLTFSTKPANSTPDESVTERMRIDSSGNLLVGKTSSSSNVVGTGLFPSGSATFCRDGAEVVYVNRKTNDGELIRLAKDGTTVGSIGVYSGDITVGNGNAGLIFNDAVGLISPWDMTANAVEDNAIDLGYSGGRFKDLYLSGGLRGDTLTFSSLAGSERMRIDSSGNLLVGTTEAESKLTVNTTRYSTHTTSGGRQYKLFDMASVGANNTFQDIINITSPGGFNSANYYSGLLGTLRVSVVGQTTNYINQVATKTYSVYASMTGTNAITVSLTEVTGFATGTAGTITAQAKSGATASLAAIEAKIAMTSTFSNAKIMYSFECEASTPYPTYQKLTPAVA